MGLGSASPPWLLYTAEPRTPPGAGESDLGRARSSQLPPLPRASLGWFLGFRGAQVTLTSREGVRLLAVRRDPVPRTSAWQGSSQRHSGGGYPAQPRAPRGGESRVRISPLPGPRRRPAPPAPGQAAPTSLRSFRGPLPDLRPALHAGCGVCVPGKELGFPPKQLEGGCRGAGGMSAPRAQAAWRSAALLFGVEARAVLPAPVLRRDARKEAKPRLRASVRH